MRLAAAGQIFARAYGEHEIENKRTSRKGVTERRRGESWEGWDESHQGKVDLDHGRELGDRGGVRAPLRGRGCAARAVGTAPRAAGSARPRAREAASRGPAAHRGGRARSRRGEPGGGAARRGRAGARRPDQQRRPRERSVQAARGRSRGLGPHDRYQSEGAAQRDPGAPAAHGGAAPGSRREHREHGRASDLSDGQRLQRDQIRRAGADGRDEPRRGGDADPRLRGGPRLRGDGILRGAVPRRPGARQGGVPGIPAAHGGRRGGHDRLHREPPGAREYPGSDPRADGAAQRVRGGPVALTGRALVAVVALAACDNGSGAPPPQASNLRVLHTIRAGPSLPVFVDGGRGSTIAFGQLSRAAFLSPGVHELILVPSDTSHSLIVDFTAAEGAGYSAFAIDSAAGATHTVEPVIVPDTGSLPAVGHSRLRIASYAPGAPPIDAWRTQPDSSGLVMSAQPLNFRALTRFFDGAPGAWSVVISRAGITDTLLATGPIAMADGQAQTIVVLDSIPGLVTWRLVPNRN